MPHIHLGAQFVISVGLAVGIWNILVRLAALHFRDTRIGQAVLFTWG